MNKFDTALIMMGSGMIGFGIFALVLNLAQATPRQLNNKWEKEAIQRGYGHYVVTEDKLVKFEWKNDKSLAQH